MVKVENHDAWPGGMNAACAVSSISTLVRGMLGDD